MFTIYLGNEFVSPRDARFSHLSAQAREAAYFEQFKPEICARFAWSRRSRYLQGYW